MRVVLITELFRVLTIELVQLATQSVSHNKGISKESHIFTKNKKAPRAIPNIPQQEQIATQQQGQQATARNLKELIKRKKEKKIKATAPMQQQQQGQQAKEQQE